MSKPTLSYFDAPVSRGEECRIALHIAGVDFIDNRIKGPEFAAFKAQTPYGHVPTLEYPGKPVLADSNAILSLIGRRHGLLPKDDLEAARHEAMMAYVEELRHNVGPTLRMNDEDKKKAREGLVANYLPNWGKNVEAQLGEGPFFGGKELSVADIKLWSVYRWFSGGKVDHIPATVFAAFPKYVRLHDAVRDHAGVKAWQAKSA
jgi:glutathione S-transferase